MVDPPQRAAAAPLSSRVPRVSAAIAVASGVVVVLIGWLLDVAPARALVPGTVGMKASTAVMFVLCGAALALLAGEPTARRRRAAVACAALCIALAAAFVAEYLLGVSIGIDELPFRDVTGRAWGISHPGRPALATEICFLLIGLALIAIDARRRVAEILIAPVAAVCVVCLVGYLYSIPAFYGPRSGTQMAFSTGAVFLVLALGIVMARPRGRLHALMTSRSPGAAIARPLVPVAILVPLLLGWLRLQAQDDHLLGARTATWWVMATAIVSFLFIIAAAARRVNQTVRETDRVKEEFVSVVTHELRTPLTSVAGYLDILMDDAEDGAPFGAEHRHFLEIARRNAQRLIDLVEDLLLVRRLEAGREEVSPSVLDISLLVNERLESIAPAAGTKHLAIAHDITDGLLVNGEARRLAQVIDNLVSNAVKYTPDGGNVSVSLHNGGPTVRLTVTDSGIGIPECDHPLLFEPFFRASNARHGPSQGTGLGLVISRRLIEAHGGALSFESAEGEGSTFVAMLPSAGAARPAASG